MLIKVKVKLELANDYYKGESLSYKIRYKTVDSMPWKKIKKVVAEHPKYRPARTYDRYLRKLEELTEKDMVIELSKQFIFDEIVHKKEISEIGDAREVIRNKIRKLNKEKVEFEFEVEE